MYRIFQNLLNYICPYVEVVLLITVTKKRDDKLKIKCTECFKN